MVRQGVGESSGSVGQLSYWYSSVGCPWARPVGKGMSPSRASSIRGFRYRACANDRLWFRCPYLLPPERRWAIVEGEFGLIVPRQIAYAINAGGKSFDFWAEALVGNTVARLHAIGG